MQTMLRLVGFGDNAGSGFPTILNVWKSEGWIKPELIEDTNLDQVTLVMKMEKESDDKSAEKSAESAERSTDSKIMCKWCIPSVSFAEQNGRDAQLSGRTQSAFNYPNYPS